MSRIGKGDKTEETRVSKESEMSETLYSMVASSSPSVFGRKVETWLDEAEKKREWGVIGLIVLRTEGDAAGTKNERLNSKLNKVLFNMVARIESYADLAACEILLELLVRIPSRLYKLHPSLQKFLEARIQENELYSICFACLPNVLSNRVFADECKRTFSVFEIQIASSVKQCDLKAFQNICSGIGAYLIGMGRASAQADIDMRPSSIISTLRKAMNMGSGFCQVVLGLVPQLCLTLRRNGLAWLSPICDIIEVGFDQIDSESSLENVAFESAAAALSCFGFAAGRRLAPACLIPALSKGWERKRTLINSSASCCSEIYASGSAGFLAPNVRKLLDGLVIDALEVLSTAESTSEDISLALILACEASAKSPCQTADRDSWSSAMLIRRLVPALRIIVSNGATLRIRMSASRSLQNISVLLSSTTVRNVKVAPMTIPIRVNNVARLAQTTRLPEFTAIPESKLGGSGPTNPGVHPSTNPILDASEATPVRSHDSTSKSELEDQAKRQRISEIADDNSDDDSEIPDIIG